MMIRKYSLVVHPYELIEKVSNMKQQLKSEIGWYSSVNSLAHFTICEFECEEQNYMDLLVLLKGIATNLDSQMVVVNGFASYANGAFYISVDDPSAVYLRSVFDYVNSKLKSKQMVIHENRSPHLTIGRRLSDQQILIAKNMFQNIDDCFICNGIMLRGYNKDREQYDLLNFIPFGTA